MDFTALIDRTLPGPGSALDRASRAVQAAVAKVTEAPAARPVVRVLHGNEVVGHPAHPAIVALPIGAWSLTAWHDARGAVTGNTRHDQVADAALRFGIAGAVVAVVTGLVQYPDTRDAARRETTVHSALNTIALGMYLTSAAMRSRGKRAPGRMIALGAMALVGSSGVLGGDISYRHGVGVRPQVLRDPDLPASDTSAEPLETSEARHS